MTTTSTTAGQGTRRFRRVHTTLWRDTGRHVLALPPGAKDVVVLGGGAAVLWRLLQSCLDLEAIVAAVTDGTEGPGSDEITASLDQLVGAGLVAAEDTAP